MREGFDMLGWIEKVKERKMEMDALAAVLENYGAHVENNQDHHDVAALHYRAVFSFPEDIVVTVGIILMDHQTDSDLVIETMTTLPKIRRRHGFGSKAIANILRWASDNSLKKLRATQVVGQDNENFWIKNGFSRQKEPNRCNDFVLIL